MLNAVVATNNICQTCPWFCKVMDAIGLAPAPSRPRKRAHLVVRGRWCVNGNLRPRPRKNEE